MDYGHPAAQHGVGDAGGGVPPDIADASFGGAKHPRDGSGDSSADDLHDLHPADVDLEHDEHAGDGPEGGLTPLMQQTLNADGTPKRPMNAFMIFARKRRPEVSAANVSMRTGEISKILSKEWNAMSTIEKQFYQDQAKKLKDVFNNRYPDYVYRRRPNNSRKKRRASLAGGGTGSPVDDPADAHALSPDGAPPDDLPLTADSSADFDPLLAAGFPSYHHHHHHMLGGGGGGGAEGKYPPSPGSLMPTRTNTNAGQPALYGYPPASSSYTHAGRDPYPLPRRSPDMPYALRQGYAGARSHTPSSHDATTTGGSWYTASAPNQVTLTEASASRPTSWTPTPTPTSAAVTGGATASGAAVDLNIGVRYDRSSSAGSSTGSSASHTHTHTQQQQQQQQHNQQQHQQASFAAYASTTRSWPDVTTSTSTTSTAGGSPTSFFPTLSSPFYPSHSSPQIPPASHPHPQPQPQQAQDRTAGAGTTRTFYPSPSSSSSDAPAYGHPPPHPPHPPPHEPYADNRAARDGRGSGSGSGSGSSSSLAPVLTPLSTSTFAMNPPAPHQQHHSSSSAAGSPAHDFSAMEYWRTGR